MVAQQFGIDREQVEGEYTFVERTMTASIAKQAVVKKCNEADAKPGRSWCVYKETGGSIDSPQPSGWPKTYESKEAAEKGLKMMKTYGEKKGQIATEVREWWDSMEETERGKFLTNFEIYVAESYPTTWGGLGDTERHKIIDYYFDYYDQHKENPPSEYITGEKQDPLLFEYMAERKKEAIDPRSIEYYSEYYKDTGYDRGLTEKQEAFNRQLGAVRVRVEHCIGWVKNWAIIATRFRCAHSIYTLIMQVVCGLVNWQTQRWQLAKT